MAKQEELRKGFTLGGWVIKPNAGQIQKESLSLHIEPKLVEVLLYLAQKPGEVISREELLDHAWHRQVVCDEALTRTISELRTLLGDSGRERRYIRTVPKRGYSLIAEPELIAVQQKVSSSSLEEPFPNKSTGQSEPIKTIAGNLVRFWLYTVGSLSTALAALLLVVGFATGDVSVDVVRDDNWAATSMGTENFDQTFRNLLAKSQGQEFRRYAVLPFANLTPSEELGPFTQGLEEDIRTALFSLEEVQVAGRMSSNYFRSAPVNQGILPVQEISKALNVDAIVDGTVRLIDGQIRVTVELLDGKTGFPLWSKRYDQAFNQVLKLQTLISEDVLCELESRLPKAQLIAVNGKLKATKEEEISMPAANFDRQSYGHTRHIEWLAR